MLKTKKVKSLILKIKSAQKKWPSLEKSYLNCVGIRPENQVKIEYDQVRSILVEANNAINNTKPGFNLFDERTVIEDSLINNLPLADQQTLLECIKKKLKPHNKGDKVLGTLEIYIELFQELPDSLEDKRTYILNSESYAKKFKTINAMMNIFKLLISHNSNTGKQLPKEIKDVYKDILALISDNIIVNQDEIIEKNEEELTNYLETANEEQIYAYLSLLAVLTKRNEIGRLSLLEQTMIYLEVWKQIEDNVENVRREFLDNIEHLRELLTEIKNKYNNIVNLNDAGARALKPIYNYIYNFIENKGGSGNALKMNFLDPEAYINEEYKSNIDNRLQRLTKKSFFSFIYTIQDIILSKTLSTPQGIDINFISKINELQIRALIRQKRQQFAPEKDLVRRKILIDTAITNAQSDSAAEGIENQIAKKVYIEQLESFRSDLEDKIATAENAVTVKNFGAIVNLEERLHSIEEAIKGFSNHTSSDYISGLDERSLALDKLKELKKEVEAKIAAKIAAEKVVAAKNFGDIVDLAERLQAIRNTIRDFEAFGSGEHIADEHAYAIGKLKQLAAETIVLTKNFGAIEELIKRLQDIKSTIAYFEAAGPHEHVEDADERKHVLAKLNELKTEVEAKIGVIDAKIAAKNFGTVSDLVARVQTIESTIRDFAAPGPHELMEDAEERRYTLTKLNMLKTEVEAKIAKAENTVTAKNFGAIECLVVRLQTIENTIIDFAVPNSGEPIEDADELTYVLAKLNVLKDEVESKIAVAKSAVAASNFRDILDLTARLQAIRNKVIDFSATNCYIKDTDVRLHALSILKQLTAETIVLTKNFGAIAALAERLQTINEAIIFFAAPGPHENIEDADELTYVLAKLNEYKAEIEAKKAAAESAVAAKNFGAIKDLTARLQAIKSTIAYFEAPGPHEHVEDADELTYVLAKLNKYKAEIEAKKAAAESAVAAKNFGAIECLAARLQTIKSTIAYFEAPGPHEHVEDADELRHVLAKLNELKTEVKTKIMAINAKIAAKNFADIKVVTKRLQTIRDTIRNFSTYGKPGYIIKLDERSYALAILNKLELDLSAKIAEAEAKIAAKKFEEKPNIEIRWVTIKGALKNFTQSDNREYIEDEDVRSHVRSELKMLKEKLKAKIANVIADTGAKIAAKKLDKEPTVAYILELIRNATEDFIDNNNNDYIEDTEERSLVIYALKIMENKIKSIEKKVAAKNELFQAESLLSSRLRLILSTITEGSNINHSEDKDNLINVIINNCYLAELAEIENAVVIDLQNQVWKDLEEVRDRYTNLRIEYDAEVLTLTAESTELRDLKEAAQAVHKIVKVDNIFGRDLRANARIPIHQINISTGLTNPNLIVFAEELSKLLHGPDDELKTFASVKSKLLTPVIAVQIAKRYLENGLDMGVVRAAAPSLEGFDDYAIGEILKHVEEEKGECLAQELRANVAEHSLRTTNEVEVKALSLVLRELQTPEVQRAFSAKVMDQINTNNDPFLNGFVSACKANPALQVLAAKKVQEVLATGVADKDDLKGEVKEKLAQLVMNESNINIKALNTSIAANLMNAGVSILSISNTFGENAGAAAARARFKK